jgi:putative ABC transport system substrate-binding protein
MKRREFIAGLGGAAASALLARAQQPTLPVIGYVGVEARRDIAEAFRQGLAEIGYAVGRNVAIDYRWSEGKNDRFPALAADLVRRQVSVVVAITTAAALAAKAETSTIPIVFGIGSDPIIVGLVASINRPGANVTGITELTNALTAKRLEMLHTLMPKAASVAMLVNAGNPNAASDAKEAQAAASLLGLQLLVLSASGESEIEAAIANIVQQQAAALLVGSDAFLDGHRDQIIALAARHAVPTMYEYREDALAGGLMSYGPNNLDALRQVGVYAGRILKGDKPADLPVQQATRIELVINMKTAKALGLMFPLTLLGRADEVIE